MDYNIPFFPLPPKESNGKVSTATHNSVSVSQAPLVGSSNYDEEAFQWCLSVHNKKYEFTQGNRHRYMLLLGFFCNTYGVSQTYCQEMFLSSFKGNGVQEKEITNIIAHCYKNTSQHGNRIFVKYYKDVLQPSQTGVLTDKFIKTCLKKDEIGDANLFIHLFKGKKLFDWTSCEWLNYVNGRWALDVKKKTRKEAIDGLTKTYHTYAKEVEEQIKELCKIDKDSLQNHIKALEKLHNNVIKRIAALHKNARSKNILELAAMDLGTVITEFDTQPHLLNLKNGVYDFDTNTFRHHNSTDLFLHQSKITYDAEAACEKWIAFLNKILNNDKELIAFVQKCIGYSLTGFTDLQALLFCFGKGANGKSVLFSVIRLLLAEYYISIPITALLSKNSDSTTEYYMATLKGARMVVASEIPKGRRFNESQIKDLTGGELINGRFPHGKPFTFDPTHKLWLFGNHKPVVKGTDHGIWRRILLIPFTVTIPKGERRKMSEMLKDFKQELPGILNWAIEGYKDVIKNDWQYPQQVQEATEAYQKESDTFADFLEENCKKDASSKLFLKDLFQTYTSWCKDNGHAVDFTNSKQMSEELRSREYLVAKGTGNLTQIEGIAMR